MRNGNDSRHIVVDTHLWIEFLGRKANKSTAQIGRLIDLERVRLVGPVLYEVLVGIRNEGQRQFVRSILLAIPMLDASAQVWVTASELGRRPVVISRHVPISDIQIAAHCEVHNCLLFSRDAHFNLFPKLRRYSGE